MSQVQFPTSCNPPRRCFVSTRRYTAVCPTGTNGNSVTIVRTCRSEISQEHADRLAHDAAKREANLSIRCYFEQRECVVTDCGSSVIADATICRTGYSLVSDADAKNLALAAVAAAAAAYCATGEDIPPDPPY